MIRARLAVLLTILALSLTAAAAQQAGTPDYDLWTRTAAQNEELIAQGDASTARLGKIRQDLVDWRRQFEEGRGANADAIAAVQAQIDALGPVPAEGATEPADIAAQRADLQRQLAELQAPRATATAAFERADAMIRSIDQQLTDRQVNELTRLSTSPLLPTNWMVALSATRRLVEGMAEDTRARIAAQTSGNGLRPRVPEVLGYLAAALLLLTLGRRWVDQLPLRLSVRARDYSRAVVAFVVSLAQIALPMIGLFLLIRALTASNLFGYWTRPFLAALPVAGVILFGGAWLVRQLFPARAVAYDTLNMTPRDRARAGWLTAALAGVMAVHHVASAAFLPLSGLLERDDRLQRVPMDFPEGAAVVWHFVLITTAAVLLFRLGTTLRKLKPGGTKSGGYRHRVLSLAGRASRLISLVAVGAAAIGYVNIGNLAIWPWISTLALLGVLILLQDFIADLFNLVKRGQEGAREGLAPLLIGFALVLLSIPLFLLVWGVSGTQLLEYWNRFRMGLTLGGVTLSPGAALTFLVIFLIGWSLTRALQGAMRGTILPKTRLDAGAQNALVSGLGYVGIFLAALLAITSAGIDLSSLAIVAGALSVGIGFGLQNIVSNFVSGIILLIERPVSVGDWISAGGQQGIVKRISVRSTQVETFDKQQVIVPNSDLITQPVTNWTRQGKAGRIIIPIGVSYGADTRRVARILTEIIEDQPLVTIDPAPVVLFRAITVDALNFEIRAVISDIGAGLGVTSEVYHQIVRRFLAEGIGMPFTTRDTWTNHPPTDAAKDETQEPPPPPPPPAARSRQADLPDDGR